MHDFFTWAVGFDDSDCRGVYALFSSCGDDDVDDPPIVDIPLAFLSPMAAGDYTVRITITAADIPNQIVNEQSLAIVEGGNRTYDVTVSNVPVGDQREVKVEVLMRVPVSWVPAQLIFQAARTDSPYNWKKLQSFSTPIQRRGRRCAALSR